jgi:hypothetical protein
MARLLSRLALTAMLLSLGACASDTAGAPDGWTTDTAQAAGGPGSAQNGAVVLVDQGLQMPLGTQDLPDGWTLVQDLATNPQSGEWDRHTLDIRGPQGELIRALGVVTYGEMMGTQRDPAWQQRVLSGVQGEVEAPSFGRPQRSRAVEETPGFQRVAQKAGPAGLHVEGLEVPFQGTRNGQPVQGFVYMTHFTAPQMPGFGTLSVTVLMSTPDRLQAAMAANQQMARSFQPNPAHEQRMAQITERNSQVAMQQSTAQHQQRMADNQARFDAHQQRMQGRWAASDAQMNAWRAGQASNDEMHRRTINGIRGTADVYDAQTGTTYYGADANAGAYWTDPVNGTVVGTDAYSDNPDPYRYNRGTNLDDVYNGGE